MVSERTPLGGPLYRDEGPSLDSQFEFKAMIEDARDVGLTVLRFSRSVHLVAEAKG
jgi:hypothetical protein